MVWYWEDGTDSSWLLYCHTSFFVVIELGEMLLGVKSLFLSYGMYLVCPLSGVFVWGLISMNHCWIGRVNVANSPSADVVCPQDPHPSRAHPTEWEVKKGLYIYPKWSMYLPMIFLDNSSTISISYTVYKYMQYILYIQYIYERPPKPPTFWNSYTRTLILDTIMKLSGTIGVTQKTMTLDTHVRLILLQTLNPQERWGTHKKRWPFQPRLFADVIGLVRCSYTQYIYVYRIMYTYFYIPLLCLIAACRVKTNQGPQIHLRLVACGFSMSFCDLLFVFQKNRLFGCLWHLKYICIQYVYIYIFHCQVFF